MHIFGSKLLKRFFGSSLVAPYFTYRARVSRVADGWDWNVCLLDHEGCPVFSIHRPTWESAMDTAHEYVRHANSPYF